MTHTKPPLDGVTVLDLSRVLAGPWASQLLGDYGANVIKVERPGKGDETRGWGPPFIENGNSAYFQCANRNKKSITIDFTKPEGVELIKKLASQADIILENYKKGGLAKYGLDYATLSKEYPKIVYCSITGFGQTGPLADRAGYDYLIQAMGGLMSITGQPDGVKGAEPMKVGVAVVDLFTGIYAATGILAALRQAELTGKGQHIDLSLYDCQIAMLANQAANFLATESSPTRLGNAHPNIVPYQVFKTADSYMVVAVGNDDQFVRFCEELGAPELAEQVDYVTNAARVENRDTLIPKLEPLIMKDNAATWCKKFEAVGVPCGPINSVGEALTTPQAQARDLVIDHGDNQKTVASPVRFVGASQTPPPTLGADTDDILSDLGLSEDDIKDLHIKNVI